MSGKTNNNTVNGTSQFPATFINVTVSSTKLQHLNITNLLTETVRHSLELAQGQTASGLRPLDWNTLRNWSQDDSDHGLAPSPTSSSRRELRLMSLWSLVASRPQWRSLDLTTATLAASNIYIRCIGQNRLNNVFQIWVSIKIFADFKLTVTAITIR